MRNLNRRDFIKILGAIPFLPWLKPEAVEDINFNLDTPPIGDPLMVAAAPTITSQLVKWNAAGDSWFSVDGGKTWKQNQKAPAFGSTPEIKQDGVLYVSGNFLTEDIAQLRQRISKSG